MFLQRSRCSHTLVAWAAWLQHSFSTALPFTSGLKREERSHSRAPEEYLKNCAQLCPRDTVGTQEEIPLTSSATVLNILPFFSNLPTPPHAHKPPPPLLTQPLSLFCSLFFYPFFFFFQAVTKKKFGSNDFRSALENGVLLCE